MSYLNYVIILIKYLSYISCSAQRSPVHRVRIHGVSNRDNHLYPPHNNSLVHLTIITHVRHTGRITDMECGVVGQPCKTHFNPDTGTHNLGMAVPRTASVRLNRLRTCVGRLRSCLYKWGMASSAACEFGAEEQTVDHVVLQCPVHRPPVDCTAWRFWIMRQSNGCSTLTSRCRAAKQWSATTRSKEEDILAYTNIPSI